MTTFVIDAELEADFSSVVVGSGAYSLDPATIPDKNELDFGPFEYPVGLVVAGGKEVWEYPDVHPIEPYAALGPDEPDGSSMATPWPEDEMVSADMHFNLGMVSLKNAEILENHEQRLLLLESAIEEILGELDKPDFSDYPSDYCSRGCTSSGRIQVMNGSITQGLVDLGFDPPKSIQDGYCKAFSKGDPIIGYWMPTNFSANCYFTLNETCSFPMTVPMDGGNNWYSFRFSTETTSDRCGMPEDFRGFEMWFSKEPNGTPLQKLSTGTQPYTPSTGPGEVDKTGSRVFSVGVLVAPVGSAALSSNIFPGSWWCDPSETGGKLYFNILPRGYGVCANTVAIVAKCGIGSGAISDAPQEVTFGNPCI